MGLLVLLNKQTRAHYSWGELCRWRHLIIMSESWTHLPGSFRTLDSAFRLTQTPSSQGLPTDPLLVPFLRTMEELWSNRRQFNYSNKLFSSWGGKVGILMKASTLGGEGEWRPTAIKTDRNAITSRGIIFNTPGPHKVGLCIIFQMKRLSTRYTKVFLVGHQVAAKSWHRDLLLVLNTWP